MKPDFVHQLVRSLTKSEKRYFKIQSQLQPGTKNYLQLFDALEGIEKYDAKLLKDKLGNRKMNLSYEKNYLKKMLMKSLRGFHDDDTQLYQIGKMLLDIEILENKSLFEEANQLVDAAIEIARNKSYDAYLPLLFHRKGKIIWKGSRDIMTENDARNFEKAYKNALEQNTLIAEFEMLQYRMARLYVIHKMSPEDNTELEEIINGPLMQTDPEKLPFYAHLFYLTIKAIYKQIKGEAPTVETIKAAELWMAQKSAQLDKPAMYMVGLNNAAMGYAYIDRLDKMEEMIHALEKVTSLNAKEALQKQKLLIALRFVFFGRKCTPGDASAWLSANSEALEAFMKKSPAYDRYEVLYQMGLFYMADGKAALALDFMNRIDATDETETFIYYPWLLILILATHYDLGNYKLLPHLIRSTKRTFSKINKFSSLEKTILSEFKKIAQANNSDVQKEMMKDFLKKVKLVEYEKTRHHVGLVKAITNWINSKIENQPMIVFMKDDFKG